VIAYQVDWWLFLFVASVFVISILLINRL